MQLKEINPKLLTLGLLVCIGDSSILIVYIVYLFITLLFTPCDLLKNYIFRKRGLI